MKPSERILKIAEENKRNLHGLAYASHLAAILEYLDEQHETKESPKPKQ